MPRPGHQVDLLGRVLENPGPCTSRSKVISPSPKVGTQKLVPARNTPRSSMIPGVSEKLRWYSSPCIARG
ncbi:MAG: hypothetical protein P8Y93_06065 [Acidobacteriota bacterium]